MTMSPRHLLSRPDSPSSFIQGWGLGYHSLHHINLS